MTPSLRRPLGILAVLVGIFAYCLFAVWLFEPVGRLHPLIQLPIWAVLGVAWVFPLKPVMIWIETGKWRP
ncbi:MAG: DUF2842 domain-containing protein [Sphingomonas sp.]|nr:MAG: DUF2842 domain-containing protein [Sphingomonas sp.]